ncbi:TIR domain-containing protein [Actinoplanes sp. CA-142083]|uniref:TIR domain-containing protein n=1 Tax=Actinoplanes sp. CA-142083 TaxID=3239903 RepID=UPI003D8BDB36
MTFDGFISYSHAADGRLAPAVQRGLHRLAKPWHRRRALWIFRDQTGLAVTPGLWSSIQTALDGSEYFVLLASPEAARSPWVNREIEHWIATKSANRILPVVTDGEWAWDEDRGDFREDSTAVPPALRGVFAEEPFFLDLRWARGSEHLSLHHSRFRDAIAQLAAPMHGVSKDELEGEDVRQHRRAKRLRSGALVTLLILALVTSLTGLSAVRNAERAKAAAAEALRQQQVADTQRDSAQRSAEEARRQQELARQQQDLAEQQRTRAAQAAAVADKSERLAREQQQVAQEQQRAAGQAAAEAQRQRRLADQAASRTREQQRLAAEASERAKQAAERAKQAQAEAQRLARIAAEQRRLADEAAAEAAAQQAKADQQQRIAVSRRLMNQVSSMVGADPLTALMLGAAAQQINPDVATRRQLTGVITATHYAGTIGGVTAARYAPDGVLVALGSDGRVGMWNVKDPRKPVRIGALPGTFAADDVIELSMDGRTLAVGTRQEVAMWDLTDRSRPARLGTVPTARAVSAVAFRGDAAVLVVGDVRGASTVWDTSDRMHPEELTTLTDDDSYGVERLAFSPDGRRLVVDKGRFIPVFDLSEPSIPMDGPVFLTFGFTPMAFSPDSSTLAVGEADGTVYLYDMRGDGPPLVIRPDDPGAPAPATPATPTTPATPDEPGGIEPPPPLPDDPDVGPFDKLTGLSGQITAVAFSPDGSLVAAGDRNGMTTVWNLTSEMTAGDFATVRAGGAIRTLSFDTRTGVLTTADASATATLWNVTGPGAPQPLAMVTAPASHRATVFGSDGHSLVVAGGDGKARTWDIADPGHPVRRADVALGSGVVRAVRYSPDNRKVAVVATDDRTLTLADATRPDRTTTLAVAGAPVKQTSAPAFSPDGRTMAVISGSTTLMLWDVTDIARPVLRSSVGGDFGGMLKFGPDGQVVATSGYSTPAITLWNVANRAAPGRLATMLGHSGDIYAMAFSPDGHTLASGGLDDTTVLWDITKRTVPLRLATLTGHARWVTTLAFSPDGRTLATGGGDLAVMLWDTSIPAVPVLLGRLRTPSGQEPTGLVFRADGRTLAVPAEPGGNVSSVTLWSYNSLNTLRADPAIYACAVTGRGLNADEWARYIPEVKYRRTCAR